jgi:excisionase family DNA binding protein
MTTSRRTQPDDDDNLALALGAAMGAYIDRAIHQALVKVPAGTEGITGGAALLDVGTVAERLSVSEPKVKRLIAAGELRSVLLGRRRLVPSEAVTAYIRSLEAEQLRLF